MPRRLHTKTVHLFEPHCTRDRRLRIGRGACFDRFGVPIGWIYCSLHTQCFQPNVEANAVVGLNRRWIVTRLNHLEHLLEAKIVEAIRHTIREGKDGGLTNGFDNSAPATRLCEFPAKSLLALLCGAVAYCMRNPTPIVSEHSSRLHELPVFFLCPACRRTSFLCGEGTRGHPRYLATDSHTLPHRDAMDIDRSIRLCAEVIHSTDHENTNRHVTDKLQSLFRELNALKRQYEDVQARMRVERDILSIEMHNELVDREANAARVAERQRGMFERASALKGQLDAFDKANQSAACVESAVANLCPLASVTHSLGCRRLDGA